MSFHGAAAVLWVVVAILAPAVSQAAIVTFPDPNLEAAIRAAISKPTGDILDTDLVGVGFTTLNAFGAGISDLTGLEYCTDLMMLYLDRNYSISDLSPLSGLTSLTNLSLYYNSISDLSPLSGLTSLTRLDLYGNSISDLSPMSALTSLSLLELGANSINNLSPLSGLSSMTQLHLYNNSINDISPLSGLTSLTSLSLDGNSISDISPLSGLTSLTWLWLGGNSISDLSPLTGLTSLTSLWLGGNSLSDVSPLSGLTSLIGGLYLDHNSISDISPLSGLTSLTYLDLDHNSISDLSPLSGLTSLTLLELVGNSITDISPLIGLTNLTYLELYGNSMSDISPLSGLTSLAHLRLDSNSISDLSPLSGLTSLTSLNLSNNSISDINPLSGLTSLTYLSLGGNSISDLSPLSGLTSLTELGLYYNSISDLSPITGLTSLTSLWLGGNSISDLSPLSGLTSLTRLGLEDNLISDLSPLSGLTSLNELYLGSNSISNLSPLSGLTSLTNLELYDNSITDVTPLGGLTNLQVLWLQDNPLGHIVPLVGLVNLTELRIDDVWAPQVAGAVANDVDDSGTLDAGETIGLIMTKGVTVSPGLTPAAFSLPVTGDSLGGAGFSAQVSPTNSRIIILTLGASPSLTIPGTFSTGATSPGSPSGIDIASGLPFNAIRGLNGVAAVPSSADDILYTMVANSAVIGSSGGSVKVTNSPDAAYTEHELSVPAGALPGNTTLTLQPPPENLGVMNAVQVDDGGSSVSFASPATLTLEYRDSDVDYEMGQTEAAMRVHQLVENPIGVLDWVELPDDHTVDTEAMTVSVPVMNLNPMGSVGSKGIFGNLVGETIEECSYNIAPGGSGAKVVLSLSVAITGGPESIYELHRIEIPGYELTTPTDPDRTEVTISSARLIDRISMIGGNSFPESSHAIFVIQTRDAYGHPIAFDEPADMYIEFLDGALAGYDAFNDVVNFDGEERGPEQMRLVKDVIDGAMVHFEFVEGITQTVTEFPGGGKVEAMGVPNLTAASGKGVWGAVAKDFPPTAAKHWELYQ